MSIERLEEQLQYRRREISTDKLSMSVGELSSLYGSGDLIIRPAFQRLFRWEEEQRTRLVESFLLRIPIPPIFVSTDEEGKWEVIDGLQRISTLLQLQGLLPDQPPLVLGGTQYLPNLEGASWGNEGKFQLGDTQKRDILRSRIDVTIIERTSDASAKFDLFQRLNSLGSALSGQEIRNAMLQSISPAVADWVIELSENKAFNSIVKIGEKEEKQAYSQELVLRFLALHSLDVSALSSSGYLTTLLDNFVIALCEYSDEQLEKLERIFSSTFEYFAQTHNEDIFKIERDGAIVNRLSITAFEILALGVGNWFATNSSPKIEAKEYYERVRDQLHFSSSGKSAEQRMKQTIPKGRSLANEFL